MRKHMAGWLRRLANSLDPPKALTVEIDCNTAPFLEALDKLREKTLAELGAEIQRSA